MMRNRIFGGIGVVWGGAILLSGLVPKTTEVSASYSSGQLVGYVVGGLMLVVGGYYLVSGGKNIPNDSGPSGER